MTLSRYLKSPDLFLLRDLHLAIPGTESKCVLR